MSSSDKAIIIAFMLLLVSEVIELVFSQMLREFMCSHHVVFTCTVMHIFKSAIGTTLNSTKQAKEDVPPYNRKIKMNQILHAQ